MNQCLRQVNRKRSRATSWRYAATRVVVFAFTAAVTLPIGRTTVHAFTFHSANPTRTQQFSLNALSSATERLSHEEQQELLRKAVEMRRIRTVEQDLKLRSMNSSSKLYSALQLSRETGYGDELTEMEDAIFEGEQSRELLVTSNMGLVHYCVNEILKQRKRLKSITKEDLIQEGAIGLARAVDRWNPAVGGKFSTYAYYWIRAAILRCIAEKDEIVRVPEHMQSTIRKISKAAMKLGLHNIDENVAWKQAAAAKALAEEAGLTDKQLEEAMKVRERRKAGILSYESWMQQGKNYETDLSRAVAVEDRIPIDKEQMKQILSRFLRPREVEALSWRYGLNQDSNTVTATTHKKRRDYVAEAEAHLFGDDNNNVQQNHHHHQEERTNNNNNNNNAMPKGGKWGEAMSFVEVGKHMQISAEYGRRLCHAAIEKLQRAAEEGTLEPALLF